jgi:tetratricopeptide (TPR) repeat protein
VADDVPYLRHGIAAGLAVLVAIGLFALALPRTIAAFATIPSSGVLQSLQNLQEQPPASNALDALIASQQRGMIWVNNGRFATDLGLAKLLVAEGLPADNPEARKQLESAIQALRQGLALAPGNPYAWARLAYAEARLHGWRPQALSALRLALLTATHEPPLLWSRLRLSFLAWSHMPPEDRDMVMQQVRIAWDAAPGDLARLAVDLKQVKIVRDALAKDPAALAEFDRLVRSQPS